MSFDHTNALVELGYQPRDQLDPHRFVVRFNAEHVRRIDETYYYIPDIFVFPAALAAPYRGRFDLLEVYDPPLPLVVEIWSQSISGYDVDSKLPEYRRRGNLEIWRLHPFEKTLTIRRRRSDGGYDESVVRRGTVEPIGLPGVAIDLDALFAER